MKRNSGKNSRWLSSIQFTIPAGMIVILGIVLFIAGKIVITEQRDRMLNQVTSYGQDTADFIAHISAIPIQKYSFYQLENYVNQLVKGQSVAYCIIYDAEGATLTDIGKPEQNVATGEHIKVFTALVSSEGTVLGQVELALDISEDIHTVNRTSLYIGLALTMTVLLVGLALSLFLHNRIVSPIQRLASATREIAGGQFHVTTSETNRSDEIGRLAGTINEMSKDLRQHYEELEEMVAARTAELTDAKNRTEAINRDLTLTRTELQNLLDNSPVGIAFINFDRVIERVNPEITQITGYRSEELVGRTSRIIYATDDEYNYIEKTTYSQLKKNGSCQTTARFRKKDGSPITCALRGKVIGMDGKTTGAVWTIEDITTRLQMEEELLKIKKLESISILTGGIAHDFNNILVALIGNLSLGEHIAAEDSQLKELFSSAKEASLRAKELTTKLLTFAGTGSGNDMPLFLPEIITAELETLTKNNEIKCIFNFPEDFWPIAMEKTLAADIIIHLGRNAISAMDGVGQIEVTGININIDQQEQVELPTGPYVQITFADNGAGIPESIINNIFDPYFSTAERSSKRGGGLGLALVHTIISQHGGTISVNSTLGEGAVFSLLIPALPDGKLTQPGSRPLLLSGRGDILIIGDNQENFRVLAEMLSFSGYNGVYVQNGRQAMAELETTTRQYPIKAVILDIDITGADGNSVSVRRIREWGPHLKLLVTSDYIDASILRNYEEKGFAGAITRPYQLLEVSRAITRALGDQNHVL